jgi:hypothetical protein
VRAQWQRTLAYSVLALYFLFAMEWLFYVTKPSFFSVLTPWQSAMVLLVAPLPYVVVALAWLGLAGVAALARVPMRIVVVLWALAPALFLCSALILMIDNFTYTVLGFGVSTVRNAFRLVYAGLFVGLFAWLIGVVTRLLCDPGREARWLLPSIGGLVGVSFAVLLLALATRVSIDQPSAAGLARSERPPDIFLISGDAFEVEHFERYGNPVESGSFFGVLGPHAVAFENSFPNANRTGATTALALTGKHAMTTHKHNSSRFFTGRDAYQHLPGVLRSLGYRSIQIGAGHHVDSFYWGMRNAFDVHNDTTADRSALDRFSDALGGRLNWEFHFSQVLANRVWERLRHAFGGALIDQPHLAAKVRLKEIDGKVMVDQLLGFLHEHPGPVFAQLHSMTTLRKPEGSTGPVGKDLDDYVRWIVEDLKRTGRFENSIIVIWSDHGQRYAKNRRLPLIIKFPEEPGIPPNNLAWNTQTLDIAPTILDYLGVPVPEWMEGRSLLRPTDRYEPIFGIMSRGYGLGIEPGSKGANVQGGVSNLGVIVCDHWWRARFKDGRIYNGPISGHTTPCDPERLPGEREIVSLLAQHLLERGYGTPIGGEAP